MKATFLRCCIVLKHSMMMKAFYLKRKKTTQTASHTHTHLNSSALSGLVFSSRCAALTVCSFHALLFHFRATDAVSQFACICFADAFLTPSVDCLVLLIKRYDLSVLTAVGRNAFAAPMPTVWFFFPFKLGSVPLDGAPASTTWLAF